MRRLLLFALVFLTGCKSFQAPGVGVAEVSVTEATDEALGLTIVTNLINPNNAPVELYEFRYSVDVDGKRVYSGRHAGGATLSAAGSRTLSLPAVVPYERVGWQAHDLPASARYSISGKLQYNAPTQLAEILLDTGVRRPKVGFSDKGQLAIR